MNAIKKWVVSDQYGKDIFYFELYTIEGIPNCLYFDSNLTFQVKHEKLIDQLWLLISNDKPIDKKEHIANQFFALIKENKFYERFYFKDTVLDKHGKLNMASYNLLNQMTETKLQSEYSRLIPFSSSYNEEVFTALEEHYYFNSDDILGLSKEVSWKKYKTSVIKRVFERGNEIEKKKIIRFYGKDAITKVLKLDNMFKFYLKKLL